MAKIGAFRFWCQKVLPLVYDDSISYYELLNKMVVYLNNVISDFNTVAENFDNLDDAFDTLQGSFNDTKNAMLHAYDQLQSYVNDYFDNLDVQEEINNKLDEMAEDGSLAALLQPFIENQISADVAAWLAAHITPTSPAVDSSLTVSGAAADAKVTGDKIGDLKADLNKSVTDLKSALKTLINIQNPTASANNWIDQFNITAGKTFKVINDSSERVVIGFYASDKSTSLQSAVEIVRHTTGYITADVDSAYMLVFSPDGATGTITIEDKGLIVSKIENYLKPIVTINVNGSNTYWLNLPVKAGKTYKIFNGSNSYISTDAYASNKLTKVESIGQIYSGETKTYTASANAYYLLIYCPAGATIGKILVYDTNTINGELAELDAKINVPVTVGEDGDYQTVKDGIAVAVAQNRDLLIMPGVYDLVAEGIDGVGYWCPKKIYGYGAILQCHLANENWTLSPLNVYPFRGTEIYGLTIEATNCRYCVHDDMGGSSVKPFYHNVYKDCHFIHNSEPSETLLAPQCIGGGIGDKGYIEISDCIFEAKIRDVTYHSEVAQPDKCNIKICNCYFSHKPTISDVTGGPSTVVNKMYVSNCSLGDAITDETQTSIQLIEWNNYVRS